MYIRCAGDVVVRRGDELVIVSFLFLFLSHNNFR